MQNGQVDAMSPMVMIFYPRLTFSCSSCYALHNQALTPRNTIGTSKLIPHNFEIKKALMMLRMPCIGNRLEQERWGALGGLGNYVLQAKLAEFTDAAGQLAQPLALTARSRAGDSSAKAAEERSSSKRRLRALRNRSPPFFFSTRASRPLKSRKTRRVT